jgi:hypothetical protein
MGREHGGSLTTSRLLKAALTAGLGLGSALAVAGCAAAAAPRPAPVPTGAPLGPAAHSDSRITLPITMSLSFDRPVASTRTEHEVLYTVQEALRSELDAEYDAAAAGPILPEFWSGSALASAQANIASWADRGEQPVGVLRITGTAYQAPDAAGSAAVTYCAGWTDVLRGDARTHTLSSAVQRPGTAGTFTVLALHRATDHRWRVTRRAETVLSSRCRTQPPSTASPSLISSPGMGTGPSRASS